MSVGIPSLAQSGKDRNSFHSLSIELGEQSPISMKHTTLRHYGLVPLIRNSPRSDIDSPPLLWHPPSMDSSEEYTEKRWGILSHNARTETSALGIVAQIALRGNELNAVEYLKNVFPLINVLGGVIQKADFSPKNIVNYEEENGIGNVMNCLSAIAFYWNPYKEVSGFKSALLLEIDFALSFLETKVLEGRGYTTPLSDDFQNDSPGISDWVKDLESLLTLNGRKPLDVDLTALSFLADVIKEKPGK